jgi:TRAP-type transport system small permease protein
VALLTAKKVHAISSVLNAVGAGVLFLMMFLTSADVFMRFLFNRPIKGAFELTELMMVVTVFFAVAYTESKKSHIGVELLVDRLRQRAQAGIDALTSLLSLGIISVILWQGALSAHETFLKGEYSALLKIPLFYFKALVPLGALVLNLEILVSLIHSLRRVANR